MYLLAVALAFWRPWVALVDAALVTVIWIIPTFGIEHRHQMDARVAE
jgi:hypothetical protein